MIFIGIDPGLSGAVATFGVMTEFCFLDTPTANVGKGGKNKRDYLIADMVRFLMHHGKDDADCFAVLEAVHSMPGQGVSSSFTFGRGLGIWEGILSSLRIPYAKVAPQTWKKAMLADMPRDNKDSSRIAATRLFPRAAEFLTRKKDDGRAEALLMAEYGRRLKGKQ